MTKELIVIRDAEHCVRSIRHIYTVTVHPCLTTITLDAILIVATVIATHSARIRHTCTLATYVRVKHLTRGPASFPWHDAR